MLSVKHWDYYHKLSIPEAADFVKGLKLDFDTPRKQERCGEDVASEQ